MAAVGLFFGCFPALRNAIFFALLLFVLQQGVLKGQCIYSDTCRDCVLSGSIMNGQCNDGHDNWLSSSLDLNEKVGNSAGNLVCSNDASRFLDSCKSPGLTDNHVLSANCPFEAAGTTWDLSTCVDLDQCVKNRDGYLEWDL